MPAIVYPGIGAIPYTPKTIRIPHTFNISGEVRTVTATDDFYIPPFFVPVPAGQTAKIVGMRHRIKTGTSVSISLFVENTDGMSSIDLAPFPDGFAVTQARTTTVLNKDVTNEQAISLEVRSVAGTPKNMAVTIYIEYTV